MGTVYEVDFRRGREEEFEVNGVLIIHMEEVVPGVLNVYIIQEDGADDDCLVLNYDLETMSWELLTSLTMWSKEGTSLIYWCDPHNDAFSLGASAEVEALPAAG